MSRIIETAEYKKKIADLTRQTNAINAQKEELLLTLQHLNISHQQGRIGRLEYSHKWSETLAGKTAQEYVDSYDRQIYDLIAAKKTYLAKVRELERNEKKISRGITLTASLMIVLSIVAIFGIFDIGGITGFASDIETTISNATISVSISIALSNNLDDGIEFGSLEHGTSDNNATDNYNNATANATTMAVIYSSTSTVPADFCIQANNDLLNGTEKIGISNMTWSNSTDRTLPDPALETAMTTSYVSIINYVEPGNDTYFRFWLDVPSGQAAGDYNNSIEFKAVQNTKSC